eukprot:CAMPEP_0172409780 /NCGR_PEP_ID=MMETSP1061-20121228/76543_1 /TAXON_ID=37318 /ORGANISM="Pseudo-nitzschia pungens, Strain cf. pungens" /LENGTH=357 /DNA_ID=CAMNT_0013145945 /DNA_START=143 /DNA_END=1216 /DNA_ORIENTATION=-
MPRKPAKLANCYVPLPLPLAEPAPEPASTPSNKGSGDFRPDGRTSGHELRRLCLETSVVSRAAGSALVELGHTKILAEVHVGASTAVSKYNKNNDDDEATSDVGSLRCALKFAPHIGIDRVAQQTRSVLPLDGSAGASGGAAAAAAASTFAISAGKLNQEIVRRESDLSRQLRAALLPVVLLEKYPRCCVAVQVTVLQDDGSCLSAAIASASLALVDARVEISDLVVSCTVAVVRTGDGEGENENESELFLADPTELEVDNAASGSAMSFASSSNSSSNNSNNKSSVSLVCLAMTPNRKEVTLWSQSGRLSAEAASRAMELCRDGCRTMHGFLREACLSSASATADAANADAVESRQ